MSKNNNSDELLSDITCEVLEDHYRPSDPTPVEVWINSTDNTAVLWLGKDGRLYSRYGFVGEGTGGELPPDVMLQSVYDKNNNGIVDLAEGLTSDAKVQWTQIVGAPSFEYDVNWDDIINIPGDIVYQPELELKMVDVNSKFLVIEGLILERVSKSEFQMTVKDLNTDIHSATENKETFYAVVDKYVKSREGSEVSIDPEYDRILDTWYGNGQPSLSTFPTNLWAVLDRDKQVGDFYYDKLTQFIYVFIYNRTTKVYSWKKIDYVDLIEVLKSASKNRDTEDDGHRRVFRSTDRVDTKFSPGDLWMPADKKLRVAYYGANGIDPKDDQRWIPVTTYSPTELEELLDQALGDISAIYDSSNVLDTSFLYNYKLDTPIKNSDMWIYKHQPTVSTGNGSNMTIITANEDMWGTNSHVLRLGVDPSTSSTLKHGVIFGKSTDMSTLITLDRTKRYRLSLWMNLSRLEDLRLQISDYASNGYLNESNLINQTRPVNLSSLGANRWGLVVVYITPYANDLVGTTYRSEVYDRSGLKHTNMSSDLKPLMFTEGNIILKLNSLTTNNSSMMSTMNYRVDVIDDPDLRFPTIQELLDDRVKRSGVIEELRSKVNVVERKTTPEAITEIITESEAFRSSISTVTTVDKSNLIIPTRITTKTSESAIGSILGNINYSISDDLPELSTMLKSPKSVTVMDSIAPATDVVKVEATRGSNKVPSLVGYSLITEADVQSTDESLVKSRVITLRARNYFKPEVVVSNSEIDADNNFTPGSVESTMTHPSRVLSSVTYIIPDGNTVVVNYSYYLLLTVTTAGKLATSRVAYNFASVNSDGDVALLSLLAPSGSSMTEKSNGVISPSSLLIQSFVANTQVESWSIRVGTSSPWRTINPTKFTTGLFGISLSTNYEPSMGESDTPTRIRRVTITPNIRKLTDEMLANPNWSDSTTPPVEMTKTTNWTFRALSTDGTYAYLEVSYGLDVTEEITRLSEKSYELTRTVDGMTGVITQLNINVDGLTNTVDKYEAYHRFDINGLAMGKSVNGIIEAEIVLSPEAIEMKAYTSESVTYIPGPNVVAYVAQGVMGVNRLKTQRVSFEKYEISQVGGQSSPALAFRPGIKSGS